MSALWWLRVAAWLVVEIALAFVITYGLAKIGEPTSLWLMHLIGAM